MSIYNLTKYINETFINRCEALDPLIAENLTDQIGYLYYNFQSIKNTKLFTKTAIKINEIVRKNLKENIDPMLFLFNLFDQETSEIIVKKWLNGELKYMMPASYCDKISADLRLSVFEKYLEKHDRNFYEIEKVFRTISAEHLQKCCELLASKTPSIQACLLSREDIDEIHTLIGLKAISKLKTQRAPSKIDFKMLKKLGPRGRLEAMKQIMGLNRNYGKIPKLPFITNPTVDEFKEFLFPCSFKFNADVVKITKRYEEILNLKSV